MRKKWNKYIKNQLIYKFGKTFKNLDAIIPLWRQRHLRRIWLHIWSLFGYLAYHLIMSYTSLGFKCLFLRVPYESKSGEYHFHFDINFSINVAEAFGS